MRKLDMGPEISKWYSGENDWCNNPDQHTIVVWDGCVITKQEYPEFVEWVKTEANADVEPIGSFQTTDGIEMFVFLLKSNIERFSIWRFRVEGMKWWFDAFAEINGGRTAKNSEIEPILSKLGLKVD